MEKRLLPFAPADLRRKPEPARPTPVLRYSPDLAGPERGSDDEIITNYANKRVWIIMIMQLLLIIE